ncbi:MAG: ADP-ribosylglycohydrolase family protein [Armatimonadota bacterium]|nr:ADP-ribosylglycohydrolase family protein [Armatimonadota bacterium]
MSYFNKQSHRMGELHRWLEMRKEQGAEVATLVKEIDRSIERWIKQAEGLKGRPGKYVEPNPLKDIRAVRPKGPRKLPYNLTDSQLRDKMLGALLGRCAGCVLGIPVEGKPKAQIKDWAEKLGQPYPLAEYWNDYLGANAPHYYDRMDDFLKPNLDHVGQDDDLAYTVLGLLILEEAGIDFTVEDVGKLWLKYLPVACTAEYRALTNLKAGLKPPKTATRNNPYAEWIGADIRSDPWGYAAPGLPELAAEFAYRDASLSHVMNGIYGEMFFSAAIAAAFVVDDPKQILKIALTEIPAKSRMAETVKEAIRWCETDGDWEITWARIDRKYAGMHGAHTLNNAALTIMGLLYGDGDFEKTISITVMGGLDTDCTGATAGSIIGAILGAEKLPGKWAKPLGDRLDTYLIDAEEHSIRDLADRFCKIAKEVRGRVLGS